VAKKTTRKSTKKKSTVSRSGGGGKIVRLAVLEKEAIQNALNVLKDDKLKAARMLGIGKTTLYRKLKEYGW
jgi:transcriptional regulator with PAS, ATPase and Fis domain